MFATVVGARPNFIKMAPIVEELRRRQLPQVFVHTEQHYDEKMSRVFFEQLRLPAPDVHFGVGSGTHAEQTAKVMVAFERLLQEHEIERVVVAGDVNSTLACALAAAKFRVPVAHVESGLRSFDRTMPEETNRVLTDHVSDLLFVTEPSGVENLAREGITAGVHHVGNTMIDSLRAHIDRARAVEPWRQFHLQRGGYGVVALHRPSNVDDGDRLRLVAEALRLVAAELPLVCSVHPRTPASARERLAQVNGLLTCEPLAYIEFLGLIAGARVVITDSGGIQEETTALAVQCLTLRENTERPITISEGTNELVKPDGRALVDAIRRGPSRTARAPALWDGRAAERIVDVLAPRSAAHG